jgi:dihydrodipicolinate synthase/N-acetylneuraminate lyase
VENIVGVKENTTSAAKFYWMQQAVDPEDMVIICGIGHIMYPFEALFDCPGFFSEFGNFAPHLAVDIYRAFKNRDYTQLKALTDKVAPYFALKTTLGERRSPVPTILSPYVYSSAMAVYQGMIKSAMELAGLPGGKMRGPVEDLNREDRRELKQVMKQIGAL